MVRFPLFPPLKVCDLDILTYLMKSANQIASLDLWEYIFLGRNAFSLFEFNRQNELLMMVVIVFNSVSTLLVETKACLM